MIAHDHRGDLRIGQKGCTARALIPKGHAAIMFVHDLPVVEHCGVLVDCWQLGVGEAGKNGGMNGMHMHDAGSVRAGPVNAAMQAPGGGVRRVGTGHGGGIVCVDLDQRGCGDPAEMAAVRIDEETGALGVHRKREVVRHRLVQPKTRGPAKGGRKVLAEVEKSQVRVMIHTETFPRIRHHPSKGCNSAQNRLTTSQWVCRRQKEVSLATLVRAAGQKPATLA